MRKNSVVFKIVGCSQPVSVRLWRKAGIVSAGDCASYFIPMTVPRITCVRRLIRWFQSSL